MVCGGLWSLPVLVTTSHIMFLIRKRRSADVQYLLTLWLEISTFRSVCLEFFQTVTSETILKKKATTQFL